MHKFFAKPLFLGKKVVFLPECHSTNDHLVKLIKEENVAEGTVVHTDYQSQGKGQRGNVWQSARGENVLMSILLKPTFLAVNRQHFLNIIAGLAALQALSSYLDPKSLRLKWPNDLYVRDQKIGGILIENSLKASAIDHSVIGIGINLSQREFGIPGATSIFLETGEVVNKHEFMELLLLGLEKYHLLLKSNKEQVLLNAYHEQLYRKGLKAIYKDEDGIFEGIVHGIDRGGRLTVDRDGITKTYGIKEIEFI